MTEATPTTPAIPAQAAAVGKKATKVDPRTRGVWMTHVDEKDVSPHSSEIAALRDAVDNHKQATFVNFGQPLADAVKAAKAAKS